MEVESDLDFNRLESWLYRLSTSWLESTTLSLWLQCLPVKSNKDMGFPSGTLVKNLPGLGRSPAVGNGNPLQNSWLENSTDRGWRAIVNAVAKSQMWLHVCVCVCTHTHTPPWYNGMKVALYLFEAQNCNPRLVMRKTSDKLQSTKYLISTSQNSQGPSKTRKVTAVGNVKR